MLCHCIGGVIPGCGVIFDNSSDGYSCKHAAVCWKYYALYNKLVHSHTTDSSAMLTRREASTPRLRLGVLASLLVNIALKLHSEESKYTSAVASVLLFSSSCKFISSTPRPCSSTWTWTQGTCAESALYLAWTRGT